FDTARNRTIGADSEAALDSALESDSMAGRGSVLGDKATLQSLDEDRGRVAQKQEDQSDDRKRLEIAVRPARLAESRPEELAEREDPGHQRARRDTVAREHIEEEEQLDQKWRAADEFNVDPGQPRNRPRPGDSDDGDQEPDHERDDHSADGRLERRDGRAEEE